jgi:hypothetical protein
VLLGARFVETPIKRCKESFSSTARVLKRKKEN